MMLVNFTPPPTATGVRRSVTVPSPTCPAAFHPQQYASWVSVRAHPCAMLACTTGLQAGLGMLGRTPSANPLPSDTCVNFMAPPTGVGEYRLVVSPTPSCAVPLKPQHIS